MYKVHILCMWLNSQEYIELIKNDDKMRHVACMAEKDTIYFM